MDLNWQELRGLPSGDLQAVLLDELDGVMAGLSDQEEDELLASLPAPLRVLWVLNWLDFEVSQDSLLAYFSNVHGRQAALAVQALRDIGASGMADVLLQASESVTAVAMQRATRRQEPNGLPEYWVVQPYAGLSNADRLSELTDQYWAAAGEETGWGDRLDAYLSKAVDAEFHR